MLKYKSSWEKAQLAIQYREKQNMKFFAVVSLFVVLCCLEMALSYIPQTSYCTSWWSCCWKGSVENSRTWYIDQSLTCFCFFLLSSVFHTDILCYYSDDCSGGFLMIDLASSETDYCWNGGGSYDLGDFYCFKCYANGLWLWFYHTLWFVKNSHYLANTSWCLQL